jgi:flavin-dependent dehydrogenase
LTHPATGEGIYQGMRSGVLAATALREALWAPSREAEAFRSYERACRRTFTASFGLALAWQQLVRSPALDWALSAGQRVRKDSLLRRAVGTVMAKM